MTIFHQMKKRTLLLWVVLLSITLLCVQSMTLHIHAFDQDHEQGYSHIPEEAVNEHSHLTEAHLSTDISHDYHHDEIMSEIDVNQDALMKKVSSNVIVLAFFSIVITILLSNIFLRIFYRHRNDNINIPFRYLLSPPLRAPPL